MAIVDLETNFDEVKDEKCFIIVYTNESEVNDILFKIKKSFTLEIYAKPILLFNQFDVKIPSYFSLAVDKVIDNKYYDQFMYERDVFISEVNGRIRFLKQIDYESKDLALKILRYLYVRDGTLSPYQTIKSVNGYSYPKIDHMLAEEGGGGKLFESFDFLVKRNLLEPILYDRCHFCLECYSAFLNFKEVCPRCLNVDIKSEPLIHHFACAYVGMEHEFRQGKKLICPKCDKELFHIGVDYDKPSSVYTCNKCNYEFQEAIVQGTCFNCKSTFDVDNLDLRDIHEYKLTVLSENAAIFGFEDIFNKLLEENLDILPTHIFNRFVEIELLRIRRYKKSVSTIVKLNLADLDELYNDLNNLEKIKSILGQLSELIKNFLRTTDVITIFNNVIYGMLLVETPLKGAEIATGRLKKEIETLFEVNLSMDYKVEITIKEITEKSDLDELLGFFE